MAGNPKESPWYSTPRGERKRRGIEIMLSDEARERLDALAEERNEPRSRILEDLILATPVRRKRR